MTHACLIDQFSVMPVNYATNLLTYFISQSELFFLYCLLFKRFFIQLTFLNLKTRWYMRESLLGKLVLVGGCCFIKKGLCNKMYEKSGFSMIELGLYGYI